MLYENDWHLNIRLLCNLQLFNQDGVSPFGSWGAASSTWYSVYVQWANRGVRTWHVGGDGLGMAHLWHGHRTSALNLFGVSRTQQDNFLSTTPSTKNTVAGSTGDAALLAVHGEPRWIRRARTVWPRQSRRQMAVTVTQWPPICESIRAWSVAEPLLLDVGRVTVLHWKCTDHLDTRGRVCFRCKPQKRAELWEAADATFCILALPIKTTLASRSIFSIPLCLKFGYCKHT